ncbi:hypothetical protein AWU67_04855 [Microterricola viridarii]|uniref:DUF4232 domain-containing protein n=2 Tax=Microterricola viridarii TaxID=412690 RepID=A0A120I057_9MICO|nr:hypothetical protein AWU67_04855 [Microterricola viridarii]
MLASAFAYFTGYRAGRVQQADLAAIDEGHTVGAVPDPDLTVSPPPTQLPAVGEIDASWCTPEQALVLLSDRDAATGHRVQTIRAMNFSEEPCTLNGYPDIAFADAGGSEIAVTLKHGRSFMAGDAGAQAITLEPGGYAKASIGWDAMATEGQLATYELHAAMYPGLERGSWPVKLDIIAGETWR